jgi:hypothetical protein
MTIGFTRYLHNAYFELLWAEEAGIEPLRDKLTRFLVKGGIDYFHTPPSEIAQNNLLICLLTTNSI